MFRDSALAFRVIGDTPMTENQPAKRDYSGCIGAKRCIYGRPPICPGCAPSV